MNNNDKEALRRQLSLNPSKIEQLEAAVKSEAFYDDQKKAYAGNKAAGIRTRKRLKEISDMAKAAMAELLVVRKNLDLTR
ncbi:hypothetical protein [Lacihabitans soyangensis]|uniref:Histone H1 n=1 Tax=Lacihabitans soyangensis TaxID=869394 RepID=A0AAE3KU29_9BACT|nr:hypothetical protein [Lacihabitans soyangensis]MCP9765157.1 hypothetical protein [Lacihabitans soyangensis]